jgi:2-polyprenyl-3-methyl-5-hydroxy-6-metoxy-1,4-benzoquinol methylase
MYNSNILSVQAPCKSCGRVDSKILYKSQRYAFLVGQCSNCELIYVLDDIKEEKLKEMYSHEPSFEDFLHATNNKIIHKTYHKTLDEICRIRRQADAFNHPKLLDIGAGSGEFLNIARDYGFDIYGTELSSAAIRLSAERFQVQLSPLSLEEDRRSGFFDAITMLGLMEHVLNPLNMLKEAFRLMRGGGILYIYTPVQCLYDRIGTWIARFGGWTRLMDRRITMAHLQLFSLKTMSHMVNQAGFELLSMEMVCEYNLNLTCYLESLGVPMKIRKGLATTIDVFIDHGIFFKNNMRVACRKPL